MGRRGLLSRGLGIAGGAALLCGAGVASAEAMSLPVGWQVETRPGARIVSLPAGATRLQFVAVGGDGGGSRGGTGAVVSGTVDVGNWKQLELRVGRDGGYRVTTTVPGILFPGQGGGASFARLCDIDARRCTLAGIAAGGGGSGGGTSVFAVAAGGAAGAAGENGAIGASGGAGAGGAAGTSTGGAGGAGGIAACPDGHAGPAGGRGAALYGGDGGHPREIAPGTTGRIGGDGGEGWYGGGGGGAAAACDEVQQGGAGGGGGGSSIVPTGGTLSLNAEPLVQEPSVRWFVELERVAPTVTIERPVDGGSYAQGSEVTAAYACADEGGAGVARCDGTVAAGARLDTATPGVKQFTVTATDTAGNTTTRTVSYTVTVRAAVPRAARVSGLKASAKAVTFRLSAAAGVTVRVERRLPGKRLRWRALSTIRANGRAGANRVALGRRPLKPGRYRVTVTPSGSGARAARTTVTVRAKRGARARR